MSPALILETAPEEPDGPRSRLTLQALPQDTVAQAVFLSGLVPARGLCAGAGRCGRCRMVLEAEGTAPAPLPEETRLLSAGELAAGVRLACLHQVREGLVARLDLPAVAPPAPAEDDFAAEPLHAAVDFGTTTICVRLCRSDGSIADEFAFTNPQMGAGAEVVSRLAYAADDAGQIRLREATLRALETITARAGAPVVSLCLAGNPAMTSLAMGWNISGLMAAPYGLPHRGGFWADPAGASDLPLIFVPPQLSPFVGGDVAAGYAALAHALLAPGAFAGQEPEFPFVLADLGTNGELLLALSPTEALVSSVALGPALEGAGLTFGREAGPGVVTGFSLSPKGLEPQRLEGPAQAAVSGSGRLALMACLLRAAAMDRDGRFTPEHSPLLRKFFAPEEGGGFRLLLPDGMYLPARDVEEILKVKAAFSLGLQRLLQVAGVDSRAIRHFYPAGALGLHVPPETWEALGFFPPGAAARLRPAGNTSLQGAALLLQSEDLRRNLCRWAAGVKEHNMAEDPLFQERFAGQMRFAWEGA